MVQGKPRQVLNSTASRQTRAFLFNGIRQTRGDTPGERELESQRSHHEGCVRLFPEFTEHNFRLA